MRHYITRRLLAAAVQGVVVLVVAFVLVRLMPGDPVTTYLSRVRSEAFVSDGYVAQIRHELGVDRPMPVQFGLYVRRVARGDLGISYAYSQPVLTVILSQLPHTVHLALAALLIELLLGLPLGVYAAMRRGTLMDFVATTGATLGYSLPRFWIGMVLILVFSVRLDLFPVVGVGAGGVASTLHHLALPALALGVAGAAFIARMTRSAVLEVIGEDYVRTARAKGLRERAVLAHHALRNAMIPVVTVVGISFGRALGGSAIVETIFGRAGIGSLLVESILQRDYAMVQGAILVFAVGIFLVNLGVDVVYAWLNPRIRFA
jgi:peptide/nickel transport system permease protein